VPACNDQDEQRQRRLDDAIYREQSTRPLNRVVVLDKLYGHLHTPVLKHLEKLASRAEALRLIAADANSFQLETPHRSKHEGFGPSEHDGSGPSLLPRSRTVSSATSSSAPLVLSALVSPGKGMTLADFSLLADFSKVRGLAVRRDTVGVCEDGSSFSPSRNTFPAPSGVHAETERVPTANPHRFGLRS